MMRTLLRLSVTVLLLLSACSPAEDDAAPAPADRDNPASSEPAAGEPSEPPAAPPAEEQASGEADEVSAAEPPVAAEDPAGLAEQIVAAEQTIRSDSPGAQQLAAAGHLQQVAYRRLAVRPQWRDDVLARVPPELHASVAAHADAAAGLARLITPQEQLPSWRIVEPPPAEELLGYYREAQAAFGVGWEYLAGIHLVETRMGRIRGTSPAGAQGPMQFMPATWEAYGEGDIHNPRDAILAAGRYLAANGAPANMDAALFAYNRSDAYVHAIKVHAEHMRADPRTYHGYYHWQVYYVTTEGDRLLPVGYDGSS